MIQFTLEEQKLFKIIKDYAISLNANVIPRLAGGFVRDKLLNIPSSDIDIALENTSGICFATGLSETLKDQPTVHKISANPEKSKHLETAVLTICGFTIDFVHLRSESYSHTRIPSIVPGTAKEDAERRDITINSLFYNLITKELEDFTRRGLNDIKNKILDTPLDPRITLFDDPLRILRIFRFKSKLGFEISPRIYEAISDCKIKEALEKKVSNERNFIEIEKMLKYVNGEVGLLEIITNGYVNSVFKPQIQVEINREKATLFLKYKAELLNSDFLAKFQQKQIHFSILKLYSVLQYFIGLQVKPKKRMEYVNVCIIRDSLKANREMTNLIESIETNIDLYRKLAHDISPNNELFVPQKESDSQIEHSEEKKDLKEQHKLSIDPIEFIVKAGESWFESLVVLYGITYQSNIVNLVDTIFKNSWQECYLTKPVVDGDYLIQIGTNPLEFKKKLTDALILQIKRPELSKEQICLHLEFSKTHKS